MGPESSDGNPRVLWATSTQLDPSVVEIVDEGQDLLRYTFRTDNQWAVPVSGTESAASRPDQWRAPVSTRGSRTL